MNRKVLEVVVEETPSTPPHTAAVTPPSLGEVSRVALFSEEELNALDPQEDGDPTLIRSRRDAQDLREELARAERERSLAQSEKPSSDVAGPSLRAPSDAPRLVTEASALRTLARPSMDEEALTYPGRGRSWLGPSLLGVAAALGVFALLFYGQGGSWSAASVPPEEAASNPSQPLFEGASDVSSPKSTGLAVPSMKLDLVAPEEATRTAPVAESPQGAPVPAVDDARAAVAAAAEATSAQPPSTSSEDAASLVARAEALLRSDRSAVGARSAKQLLDPIMAQQRDNPHAQAALSEACLRLRDAACARAAATRAVRLRPKREAYLLLEANVQAAFPTP